MNKIKTQRVFRLNEIIFNTYLHMIIVFTFLSIFFMVIGSKKIDEKINNVLDDKAKNHRIIIKDDLYNYINKLNINNEKEINNKWLFNVLIVSICFAWLVLFLLYFYRTEDYTTIIVNNLIIFIFIITFEIIFFLKVALKYAPITAEEIDNEFKL